MKVNIKCLECEEHLGTIEKPEITAEDIERYREMVTCSQGHGQTAIHLEETE